MKNKSEVLLEYRKALNKPEKYQALRLEIEVDKRDVFLDLFNKMTILIGILNDLKEEQSCVKETK